MKIIAQINISLYPHKSPKGGLTGIYLQISKRFQLGNYKPPKGKALIHFIAVGANLYVTLRIPNCIQNLIDVAEECPPLPGSNPDSKIPWCGAVKGYALKTGATRFYIPSTYFKKGIPYEFREKLVIPATVYRTHMYNYLSYILSVPTLKRSYFH
jgi:hypothetical protein